MSELIRLRDLPGIQRAIDLCRNRRNFDHLQVGYTMEEIDDISIRLFSMTARDTVTDEDDVFTDMTAEEYESRFHAATMPWPDSKPLWDAIGWDISDGAGNELLCAHLFARQIIATAGSLMDGTRFTPDGSGTWYGEDADDEELLEERLKREADRFLSGRKG